MDHIFGKLDPYFAPFMYAGFGYVFVAIYAFNNRFLRVVETKVSAPFPLNVLAMIAYALALLVSGCTVVFVPLMIYYKFPNQSSPLNVAISIVVAVSLFIFYHARVADQSDNSNSSRHKHPTS